MSKYISADTVRRQKHTNKKYSTDISADTIKRQKHKTSKNTDIIENTIKTLNHSKSLMHCHQGSSIIRFHTCQAQRMIATHAQTSVLEKKQCVSDTAIMASLHLSLRLEWASKPITHEHLLLKEFSLRWGLGHTLRLQQTCACTSAHM